MSGETRRDQLTQTLEKSTVPLSGSHLAKVFHVSRQVIVNDIALLRAQGCPILSTNKGYLIKETKRHSRIFKERHTNKQTREEYAIIVDHGGIIKNVFVNHRTYGIVKADLNLKNRYEIDQYLHLYEGSVSTPLENITDGFHYHEVEAESEEVLDLIQDDLAKAGFLAPLSEFEPARLKK